MADVNIICPSCGRSCTVSEFASAETLACPVCARRLELPDADRSPRLKVRKGVDVNPSTTASSISVFEAAQTSSDLPSSTINEVHKVRGKVKGPAKWLGWLVFLLLGSLLIGAQYYLQQDMSYLTIYQRSSWCIYGIIFFIVLLFAAEDSYLQCILCLLVPCYVIYYAFSRMESNLLRGAFLAVAASLGAEIYFLHDQALIMILQRQANALIESVGKLIQRAGESPDMPNVQPKPRRIHTH